MMAGYAWTFATPPPHFCCFGGAWGVSLIRTRSRDEGHVE